MPGKEPVPLPSLPAAEVIISFDRETVPTSLFCLLVFKAETKSQFSTY